MKNEAAVQLGRRGGKVSSDAKANAARENGAKGGRPSYYAIAEATQKRINAMPADERPEMADRGRVRLVAYLRDGKFEVLSTRGNTEYYTAEQMAAW